MNDLYIVLAISAGVALLVYLYLREKKKLEKARLDKEIILAREEINKFKEVLKKARKESNESNDDYEDLLNKYSDTAKRLGLRKK